GPSRTENVRETRSRVRLVQHEGRALEAGCTVSGSRRIAAEAHNDVDAARADELTHLRDGTAKASGKAEGLAARTAREGDLRDRHEFVSAFRNETRLKPLRGAEHDDLRVAVAHPQAVRDRKQGVHMSGGAAAGEKISRHRTIFPRAA